MFRINHFSLNKIYSWCLRYLHERASLYFAYNYWLHYPDLRSLNSGIIWYGRHFSFFWMIQYFDVGFVNHMWVLHTSCLPCKMLHSILRWARILRCDFGCVYVSVCVCVFIHLSLKVGISMYVFYIFSGLAF